LKCVLLDSAEMEQSGKSENGSKEIVSMIFIGPLYQPETETVLMKKIPGGRLSNATNQYQSDLLSGLVAAVQDLEIINVLPVGTWPKHYRKLVLQDRRWKFAGKDCFEVGCVNLPVLKQWIRAKRITSILKSKCRIDQEVIIYSTYLPFLSAVKNLPADVKITLVVTDLPEYYDLGRTSFVKRILRKMNNQLIYECLSRIDRYVLLTERMKEKLPVGGKPYTIVEGIWNRTDEDSRGETDSVDRKIVFYAGTLHKQFGIMNLLEAFSKIEDTEAELWLCGSGDCAGEVEKLAREDSRIKYFGYVSSDRVAELRMQATVLVNPRTNEGEYTKYSFPSKTMGYMASGKPVVMYKLDGIPQEYDEYLIYPEGDTVEGLKRALEKVLNMSAVERAAFGARAQRFIVEQKNSTLQVKKILDMVRG